MNFYVDTLIDQENPYLDVYYDDVLETRILPAQSTGPKTRTIPARLKMMLKSTPEVHSIKRFPLGSSEGPIIEELRSRIIAPVINDDSK